MKILLVHNRYQLPGGEDEVYCRERQLLINHGHDVIEYSRDNREIADYGFRDKMSLAVRTTWARDSYHQVLELLRKEKPQVVHFHNTFPLISPAAYYACSEVKVPVVQTLHNPRLLCVAGTSFRQGNLCEECAGRKIALPAIMHGCYRQSRFQTAVAASMLSIHHWLGTWKENVSVYIASTEFYRSRFAAAGLPINKIALKPHFVDPDPGYTKQTGDYALYVGRLAPEKGVPTLLTAWKKVRTIPLFIRGEGPLTHDVLNVQDETAGGVTLMPRASRSMVFDLMKAARFLVWPSEGYYETFGLVAIEAFACGVPVIASRTGVMKDVVRDGYSGLHFTSGDAEDLAHKVEWAWAHPQEMKNLGHNARGEYEAKYTAGKNYEILLDIYRQATKKTPEP